MKVYAVVYEEWKEDENCVYGVFDSREKAQKCIDEMPEFLKDWNAFVIEEQNVE